MSGLYLGPEPCCANCTRRSPSLAALFPESVLKNGRAGSALGVALLSEAGLSSVAAPSRLLSEALDPGCLPRASLCPFQCATAPTTTTATTDDASRAHHRTPPEKSQHMSQQNNQPVMNCTPQTIDLSKDSCCPSTAPCTTAMHTSVSAVWVHVIDPTPQSREPCMGKGSPSSSLLSVSGSSTPLLQAIPPGWASMVHTLDSASSLQP